MALNQPASKTDFLNAMKPVLFAPKRALDNVADFRAMCYALADDGEYATVLTQLQTLYGFTADEAGLVMNAVNGEFQGLLVLTGQATQAEANDFFFYAKRCWGFTPR